MTRMNPQAPLHEPEWPLPPDWAGPKFVDDTWASRGLSVWTREPGEWAWTCMSEDFANQPIVEWSDKDRAVVTATFEPDPEDECTIEVSWPPTPSLWTAGIAVQTKDGDLDVTLAEWRWHVHVVVHEIVEGGRALVEVDSTREHILTTKVDPRSVEYSHSALG
ncbi:hypothetical protein [Nocardioides xinjiangensis]|uniref:hypothetical protein n=1 Tax=Nocardioides xinjiangensis TaxID=2817376 RepID=UPI001B303442|nr:hypothetical protein [Nocardioides sp. SYSU D00778]